MKIVNFSLFSSLQLLFYSLSFVRIFL